MQTYIGNGHYCWANSASMLLGSVEENVESRLLEVLAGVGLGAFWLEGPSLLFLSGWTSPPDIGVSRSFRLLGFEVQEQAEMDDATMPIQTLKTSLEQGPVMVGPLDMGELAYHPNAHLAIGADHYVLALALEGTEVVLHDPAGYPCVPIAVDAFERAWRADRISYRRGSYRRWQLPVRMARPLPGEIVEAALASFRHAYEDARARRSPDIAIGAEAIEKAAAIIRQRELREPGLRHLQSFALTLGGQRALDYAWYLYGSHRDVSALKHQQALSLGRAHAAAVNRHWDRLADELGRYAELEHEFETSLATSVS